MKKLKSLNRFNKSQLTASLFAVIFAGIGVYILAFTHAATTNTLTLSPASGTVALGGNFTVTIVENSGTEPVNAIEADLTFNSSQLQYVGEDTATSSSAFDVQVPARTGTGSVAIARGATTAKTGQQNVAVLTFKALTLGSSTISFAGTSAIVNTADHVDILGGVGNTTGATYTATDQTAPNAPTGATSSGVTATSVTLNWTAPTDNVGVTGYNVYRNGTLIGTSPTTTSTTYTDNGRSPSTAYVYTIKARDATGNLSSAATVNVTTSADTTAPTVPAGLTSPSKSSTSVSLSWSASTDNVGVTGYNVYRNGALRKTGGPISTTSYNDIGLTASTAYAYTVKAIDAAGNLSAAQGTPLSVTTDAAPPETTPPSTPQNLKQVFTDTNTAITLKWDASTDNVGVAGYNVYRNGTLIGTSPTTTSTTYTDTGRTSKASYTYTVKAVDAAGNLSGASNSKVGIAYKDGDSDGDGKIDIGDVGALADNFGKFNSGGATRAQGDLDGNGTVDIIDLSILCDNWNPTGL